MGSVLPLSVVALEELVESLLAQGLESGVPFDGQHLEPSSGVLVELVRAQR